MSLNPNYEGPAVGEPEHTNIPREVVMAYAGAVAIVEPQPVGV